MSTWVARGASRLGPLLRVVSALAVVVAGLVAVWWPVFTSPHPIASGDLFVPFRQEAIVTQFGAFWNSVLEFPNVETLDRLAFVAPFLPLGDPRTVQLAMIAAVVLGAGVAMTASALRLGAPWILAVLAGLIYGCNPWIANRAQHLFLLPAYAVLPAVVAAWVRPPRRHAVAWTVLLLTLGSSTPHGTAALWLVSAVLVAAFPSAAKLRRLARTLGWFAATNVWWLIPVGTFSLATDLIPSWPTWEQLTTFSREASAASVARLQGYWYPLAQVQAPPWAVPAGWGLGLAALLGAIRSGRLGLVLAGLAVATALLALGMNGPVPLGPLVVEGAFADRFGWLFRDPNKLVGPLAAFLALLAAGVHGRPVHRGPVHARTAPGDAPAVPGDAAIPNAASPAGDRFGRLSVAARALLLGGYLAFALTVVPPYLAQAYRGHAVPTGLQQAAAWLEQRSGRTVWLPAYYGSHTLWNGDNVTPELVAASSPRPVLSPYFYDDRARRAFLTLDFGAVLGDLEADIGELMRRWGVRWLVHHRDVLPYRLQPAGAFDARVEQRAALLPTRGLTVARTFPGVTVYDAGPSTAVGEVRPWLTQRPTAAAAALSTFGAASRDLATVNAMHPGVGGVLSLVGDATEPALAVGGRTVDLAGAAPYAAPEERWSRFGESELAWWSHLAPRGGPPPADAGAVVTTESRGAELRTAVEIQPGLHEVWARVYRGPRAGALRVQLTPGHGEAGDGADGTTDWTVDLAAASPSMTWLRLGQIDATATRLDVRLVNLDGANVLAELRLIPYRDAVRARGLRASLPAAWLWTPGATCRSVEDASAALHAFVPPAFVDPADDPALPWDGALPGDAPWGSYRSVEVELHGHGDGRVVEVWTRSDDTWVLLGDVAVWWEGWRTARLPVDADVFAAAPRGANAPAALLRLVTTEPSGDGTPDGADPVRVGSVRLSAGAACSFEVDTTRERAWALRVAGEGTPFPVEVAGRTLTVDPSRPPSLTLPAGTHRIAFPSGVPRGVRAVWLGSGVGDAARVGTKVGAGVDTAVGGGGERDQASSCSAQWRLLRTSERYVDGLSGSLVGTPVRGTEVDGLMAGFWLPPGVCGEVVARNPWRPLGTASLVVSGLAVLALVAASFAGRVP